jgi:hypothetical protein
MYWELGLEGWILEKNTTYTSTRSPKRIKMKKIRRNKRITLSSGLRLFLLSNNIIYKILKRYL